MSPSAKKWAVRVGLVAGAAAVVVGCSVSSDDDLTAQAAAEALSRTNTIDRAMQWVNAKLKYCQSANHAHDYDSACSSTCSRQDNKNWDPYRSDCSGFVSWAWGLPAPGRITTQFAPFNTAVSHTIPGESLQPGDAVNSSDHIILFKQWQTPGKVGVFLEEPGCSSSQPYAHSFTSSVSINGDMVYISYEGKSFYAIRYDGTRASRRAAAVVAAERSRLRRRRRAATPTRSTARCRSTRACRARPTTTGTSATPANG